MASLFPTGLPVLDPAALRARVHRRSYWRMHYLDGRTVNEWDVDFSLAPLRGRQAIRLYCPNGQVAELGNTADATGRIFQFKCATVLTVTTAHVIGLIDGSNGECHCAAWEYANGKLRTFRDNVFAMQYEQVGALSPDVLGIRP